MMIVRRESCCEFAFPTVSVFCVHIRLVTISMKWKLVDSLRESDRLVDLGLNYDQRRHMSHVMTHEPLVNSNVVKNCNNAIDFAQRKFLVLSASFFTHGSHTPRKQGPLILQNPTWTSHFGYSCLGQRTR